MKELEEEVAVVEPTMDPVVWLRKQLEDADVELLREMAAKFLHKWVANFVGGWRLRSSST